MKSNSLKKCSFKMPHLKMNKLYFYIILIFLSFYQYSYADDIKDYEIEGFSIGESLLEHASREYILKEIEENKPVYNYLNNDFGEVYLYGKFKEYEMVSFFVKPNDKYFTIYSIAGMISYDDKFKQCLNKQQEIEKEFNKIYKNTRKKKSTNKFQWDPTGESISQNIAFILKSGDYVEINCTKYKKSLKIENNWKDGLQIVLNTKEISEWFSNRIK